MSKLASLILLGLLATCSAAHAGCLEDAAKFAASICGEIANEGSGSSLTGNIEAKVDGLMARALAGSGKINLEGKTDAYKGVIRDELAKDRHDGRDCRQKMAQEAIKQCSAPAPRTELARPRYSYFANSPGLIGEDISRFASIPKVSVENKLIGILTDVSEPITESGRETTMHLDGIYFYFFKSWLRSLAINSSTGGDDCNKTELMNPIFKHQCQHLGGCCGQRRGNLQKRRATPRQRLLLLVFTKEEQQAQVLGRMAGKSFS
ncbi:hypothetical protein [Bradyrhizobium ganzhouense]|uniref:hypothetical protein n=1 Tax=Bradyrhizobium ganzhouense TaxID=1179767 RepID=UPI003CF8F9F7